MEFKSSDVEQAVYKFYFVPADQTQAHQWLNLAQQSYNAWQFSWDLIQPEKAQEIQFFGANTLYIKVNRFWIELKQEEHIQLKDKLLDTILKYIPRVPNIILTRLCIVLSCVIIRTISHDQPNAISELISYFQSANNYPGITPEKSLTVLLQLLTVLPEEFQTMTLAHSFRAQVRHQLTESAAHVISVIRPILTTATSLELSLSALTCLKSWIVFGFDFEVCVELVQLILKFVPEKNLTETCADVLVGIANHHDGNKYPSSVLKFLDSILTLKPILSQALTERDLDTCCSLYNIFVSFGENHSRFLLTECFKDEKTKNNFSQLIEIILSCSATDGQYPVDENFSCISFNFWYNLQDDMMSAEDEKCYLYKNEFEPTFIKLVDALLRKLMSPKVKTDTNWTSDDIEQFRIYHQDIGDMLTYCYNVLRQKMLERLITYLMNIISCANNKQNVERELEACLYAVQSVAENIDIEEKQFVPIFIDMVINIPFNNDGHLIAAALNAIGAYGEWMSVHPEVLNKIIPLMLIGLQQKEATSAASMALKEISRDCQTSMTLLAPDILKCCLEVFKSGTLKVQDESRIMCIIGYMASLLPQEECLSYLLLLLRPFTAELERILNDSTVVMTPQLQNRLKSSFSVLSMLFITLDVKLSDEETDKKVTQPAYLILQQLLPLFHALVTKFQSIESITDAICELLKRATGNLMDNLVWVLEELLTFLVLLTGLGLSRVAVLEVFKLIALVFSEDVTRRTLIHQHLVVIINHTVQYCKTDLSENCDVAETFCQVLAQLLRKQHIYLIHDNIDTAQLYLFGIAVLSIPEASAVKAASTFLTNFINKSPDHSLILAIVQQYGYDLINQILTCVGGSTSPRGVMDSLTDVLLAMIKKQFEDTCRYLNQCLERENFPSSSVTREDKELFIKRVIREHSNRRKLQEIVKYFTLRCRGIIETEYAAQVLPSL